MSPAFARRRADRFDALVGDPTATADDARTAELLELVGALRSVPAPAPRPDFAASLREQLMAEADTVLLPRDRSVDARLTLPAARTQRTRRDRRLAVAAGTLAVVGATTSMAMAAQTALPGDALYPVKRALEDARTGVSVGEGAKGSTLLASASGRLDELAELARRDTPESSAAVPVTLEAFAEQAAEAAALLVESYEQSGEADAIATLRDFTAQSMGELSALEALLPASAREALREAAQLLAEIDATAAALCPTCGGSGVTEVPLSLLGAVDGQFRDLMAPVRATDGTRSRPASTTPGRRGAGAKGETTQQPAPEVPEREVTGPGSVFTPPAPGSAGGSGGDDPTLGGLLPGGGSTGVSGGGAGPLLEPLAPVLEPLAPLTDPVTGLVEDTLGGLTGGLPRGGATGGTGAGSNR